MCEVEGKEEMKKSEIDGCTTSRNWREGRKVKVKSHFSELKRRKKSESEKPLLSIEEKGEKWKWKALTGRKENKRKEICYLLSRQELCKGIFHAWGARPEKNQFLKIFFSGLFFIAGYSVVSVVRALSKFPRDTGPPNRYILQLYTKLSILDNVNFGWSTLRVQRR